MEKDNEITEMKKFEWFRNHGDEDGNNSFTICYGSVDDADFEIVGAEDTEDGAIEACNRLNTILTAASAPALLAEVEALKAENENP